MATTGAPFNLPYPALGDAPNGPDLGQDLAEAVHALLARALVVTSSTRPASPANGLTIVETDTNSALIAIGGNWYYLTSTTTGGTVTGEAQYSAASAQSIPNTTDTAVAFGTDDYTSAAVTKLAHGAGHKFKLNQGGVWSITAMVRYASTSATGERWAGFRTADGGFLPGDGDAPTANNPASLNFSLNQRFDTNEEVYVNAWQGTGSARLLEPYTDSAWVRINFVWLRP